MFWIALRTSHPAAKAKTIMLLPTDSVEACGKYQFLEEIDEQCTEPRTAGFHVLHVTRNSTKSSLKDFSWSS